MTALRVLVVEDEWLIARDYVAILRSGGHVVVGPASTADAALLLVSKHGIDFAVVDYKLGSGTSEPVVEQLNRAGIPVLVVTGHARSDLADAFRNSVIVSKPVDPQHMLELLRGPAS